MSRTWQSLKNASKPNVLPAIMTSSCGSVMDVAPLNVTTTIQVAIDVDQTICVKSPVLPVENSSTTIEPTAEQIAIASTERWFPRYQCPICPEKLPSSFKIDGARICLFCYDKIKHNSKLELDDIHALNLATARTWIKPQEEKKIEPSVTEPAKVPRRRGRPKKEVRGSTLVPGDQNQPG